MKNIMLVFVSDLKAEKAPVHYQIFDETIDCVQTNASAVIYMQKLLLHCLSAFRLLTNMAQMDLSFTYS